MSFQFQEKTSYPHIYVDESNQVHILVPISEGKEVATDNTCKATLALEKFFKPLDAMGNPVAGSALHSVNSNIQDLNQDLKTLASAGAQNTTIYKEKYERSAQLIRFAKLLQEDAVKNSIGDLSLGLSSEYPAPIQRALKEASNFFTLQLSPREEDSFLKIHDPQFLVMRGRYHCLLMSDLPKDGVPVQKKVYLKKNGNRLEFILKNSKGKVLSGSINFNVNQLTRGELRDNKWDILGELQHRGYIEADDLSIGLGAALRNMINKLPPVVAVTNESELIAQSVAAATPIFQAPYGQVSITKDNIERLITLLDSELNKRFPGTKVHSISALLTSLANDDTGQDLEVGVRLVDFFESFGFFQETDAAGAKYERAEVTADLLQTIVESVKQLQPSKSFKPQNASVLAEYIPTQGGHNTDKISKEIFSVALQMFLATVNAYCCEQRLFAPGHEKTNMVGIIEGSKSEAINYPFYIIKRPEGCVDIQSEETYDTAGLVGFSYRIWPNGACAASIRDGNNFIPQPPPADFEQYILPSLRAQIGKATSKWTKINVSPITLEAAFIQTIRNAIQNSQPIEKAIIQFINAHLGAFHLTQPLHADDKNILEKFATLFHTLHNSGYTHPHFDEFIFLLNKQGSGFSHQGHLCISMAEYVKGLGGDCHNRYFAPAHSSSSQALSPLSANIVFPGNSLPHKNAIVEDRLADAVKVERIDINSQLECLIYQEAVSGK